MEASLVVGAFDTEKADFLCPHFCVKKTYSRQCTSMGWLLGQAWWMWWPIGTVGMAALVRQGMENGKGGLVGWARICFGILMSFQIVSCLI
jgi:hypothetical protein